jgi:glycerophosphoryl diester phosphodiesterase
MALEWLGPVLACVLPLCVGAERPEVFFQAHRGGMNEVPENTLAAFEHAWAIPGAVPEVDVTQTQDGVLVCLHDDTPRRTTDAPDPWADTPIGDIPYDEVRRWDAGIKFDPKYSGERVPKLDELLDRMCGRPERQLYLDIKKVDLEAVAAAVRERGLEKQILFVHGDPAVCAQLQKLFEGARTMTWISRSTPDRMKTRFAELAEGGFSGLDQIQFHLPTKRKEPELEYIFDDFYLSEAVRITREAGVDLQLRPFDFDPPSLRRLIDLGVGWYVTDNPASFADGVREALALPQSTAAHE